MPPRRSERASPPLPPAARVYPSKPEVEPGEIEFRLEGGEARPGGPPVELELSITSAYEFSAFVASVVFDPGHVEVRAVREHVRPGTVHIDNESGEVGLVQWTSTRRIGAEGERVRIATLEVAVRAGTERCSASR